MLTIVSRDTARFMRALFTLVTTICVLFFAMTLAAMLLYPGGSVAEPNSEKYSFFLNFFSDLGQTHVRTDVSNMPSMLLFAFALIITAGGLALFFFAFSLFFSRSQTAIVLSRVAILCGVVAGVCFVGVALTPWNLFLQAHNWFVHWAFRAFLAAILLVLAATFAEPGLPRRFTVIFAAFGVLLAAYVGLLAFGPPAATPLGSIVQATGQKVIAYASILTVLVQSVAARSLLQGDSSR